MAGERGIQVSVFYSQRLCVLLEISAFYSQIPAFCSQIHAFCSQIPAFYTQIPAFLKSDSCVL